MKKQTAVEWLVEQIRNDKFIKASDQIKLINKALEMEKQQIINCFMDVSQQLMRNLSDKNLEKLKGASEQYYNETFKQ